MKRFMTVAALAMAASVGLQAQKPMSAPKGGKAISDELIGIFFEDISSSADGGLCAELLQNGSFEFNPAERDGWGPGTAWRFQRPGHSLGYMEPRMDNPLHPNNREGRCQAGARGAGGAAGLGQRSQVAGRGYGVGCLFQLAEGRG